MIPYQQITSLLRLHMGERHLPTGWPCTVPMVPEVPWRGGRRRRDGCAPAGSVLTLVLIVLSSMVILSASLGYRTRIELRLAHAYATGTQAHYLALGGIERAKVLMTGAELSPKRVAAIGCFAGTARDERLFEQLQGSAVERFSLMYRCSDEQQYLNVNTSDPAAWSNLEDMDAELVACILDWIDADENVRSQGAEADFYSHLDSPYATKNQPCVLPKELLFVREVTRGRYMGDALTRYGAAQDQTAGLPGRDMPDPAMTDMTFGLLDVFTVYGAGAININTVGSTILAALPGLDEQAAQAVLASRMGADGIAGTDDDVVFTTPQELAQISALTALQIELLGQYCCFQSTAFRVFSLAQSPEGPVCGFMATLKVSAGRPIVLYMEKLR